MALLTAGKRRIYLTQKLLQVHHRLLEEVSLLLIPKSHNEKQIKKHHIKLNFSCRWRNKNEKNKKLNVESRNRIKGYRENFIKIWKEIRKGLRKMFPMYRKMIKMILLHHRSKLCNVPR
jgi:hypothetical protein